MKCKHPANILFIARRSFPDKGGVENHVYKLSQEIIKDEHHVTIVAMRENISSITAINKEKLEILHLPMHKNKWKHLFLTPFRLLSKWKTFVRADFIHYHDYITLCHWSVFIYPILKILRKPVFITFHGWEGNHPPRTIIKFQRRIAEKLTKGNICIGHFIEKWYGTKATIISYGGVDKQKTNLDENDQAVFVGRLEKDCGIELYLQAWKELSKLHTNMKLIICGEGNLRPALENYTKEQQLKNVQFLGNINKPQTYMQQSRLVFSSGYLSILEAFSCKKPVIAVYQNELKEDYLKMLPNSDQFMWIAGNIDEVVCSAIHALEPNNRIEKAFKFSQANTWENVKADYYRLWWQA